MIFISPFFDFQIIREVLNLGANIRVVCHFRGLKIGRQIVVSQRSKVLVHRIAVHFSVPTLTAKVMSLSVLTHAQNHWSISESLIRYYYFSIIDLLSSACPSHQFNTFVKVLPH